MRPSSIAAGLLVMSVLGACGQNRDLPPAGPLRAEWYVIDANDRPAPGQFLRFAPPGPQGGGLDIAVSDYDPVDGGPTVHLVGVVHVADARYYEVVQRELDGYDRVLYEGVKPSTLSAVDWQKEMLDRSGEIGRLQQELAEWFGFRYQMEAIDYGRPNLVHADMTMEEFAEADTLGLIPKPGPRPADDGSRQAPPDAAAAEGATPAHAAITPAAVLSTWETVRGLAHVALGDEGPLRSLGRKMFAQTMGTTDVGASLDLVPGLSDLLLVKRNRIVLDRLVEERARTRGRIAIFYGAAHMKDLGHHLESELGYRRTGGHWLRAWALRPPIG